MTNHGGHDGEHSEANLLRLRNKVLQQRNSDLEAELKAARVRASEMVKGLESQRLAATQMRQTNAAQFEANRAEETAAWQKTLHEQAREWKAELDGCVRELQ